MPHSKPDGLTDVQAAFIAGLTDQRVANIWLVADDWADLSPEAKAWLRRADKDKIDQLNSTIEFMNASKVIWKFLWVGGGMAVGAFVGFTAFWKAFGEFFTVKIK